MRTKVLQTFVVSVAFGMGCSGTDANPLLPGGDTGGDTSANPTGGSGPLATGGSTSVATTSASTGGANPTTGGATSNPATGGSPTGGKAATGGAATGGSPTGGKPATGGSSTVMSTGGAATGGKSATGVGGAATGGAATGGKSSTGTGGAPSGGAATGGKSSTGGAGVGGGSSSPACNSTPLTGGTQHCSSNQSGTVNGLTWTIWSSGSGGCLTTYNVGGAFKATWNNSGDFLARVGLQWNETQTYDQYGTISADYSYTKTGTAGGYSFIGIYGWSNNPLVEYYIVDDWYGNGPPTGGGTQKGSFTVDGGTYKVYTHTQNNQPSIHGTATFPQYFSVRQTARQCGHISITEHFKYWASVGLNLGKMYEAKILVEAGGGVGSIDFSSATVTAK